MHKGVITAWNSLPALTFFFKKAVIKSIYSCRVFVFVPAGQEYLFPDEAIAASPLHYKAVSRLRVLKGEWRS